MKSPRASFAKIPDDTYQAARQVYNPAHIYLFIGDQKEELFQNIDLRLLNPFTNQDEESISRLAMITAFQFAESIPDVVASDATRKRIDWKYALHMPIHHKGVDGQSLCMFRQSLFLSQSAADEFNRFLRNLGKSGLNPQTIHDQLQTNDVLHTLCQITRFYRLYNAMKAALSLVVSTAPDWLRVKIPSHWYGRYKSGHHYQTKSPSQQDLREEAVIIGADIQFLVTSLHEHDPAGLLKRTEIRTIIQIWENHFALDDGQIRWRLPGCIRCSSDFQEESIP